jgi:Xaa-Pro aminopeptidase
MSQPETLLIVADSERDANMLYAVGMFAPDPFVYARIKGRCHVVMSDPEIDRARKEARHCRVLSLSRYTRQLGRQGKNAQGLAPVIKQILRENKVRRVLVPGNFPYGLARELRDLKIKIVARNGNFFPERQIKDAAEVKKISAALLMAEVGLAEGIQVLKSARVGRGRKLYYHNVPLTAEKLRAVIDIAVLQAGGLANHTIVACGAQGCNPHERGHGVLYANQPIILDVFPRSQKTGYYGDITRTVVKGRASEAVRHLYHTVRCGQDTALGRLTDGVPASDVHQAVLEYFESEGYKSGKRAGRMQGFFHGTGHGLGLDLHEAPRISPTSSDVLKAGHVVTIEPGLYYPDLGGVRLEDVVHVTKNGARNLTRFEKVLEI